MQAINWQDLWFVLNVGRAETLAAAARRLGVDETTVARRLARAERVLGARLLERVDGRLKLTDAGETALSHAERVETEIEALAQAVGGCDAQVAGTVRLTAVPILVNRVLIPALPRLAGRHPLLRLELIAEPRDLSLTKREADVALRLARPTRGANVVTRRIAVLDYAVYRPAASTVTDLPWIAYEDGMAHLPQARWLANRIARSPSSRPVLMANDAEAILEAVRAGLGRSLLPCVAADELPELTRDRTMGEPVKRELWTLVHAELRPLARIAAVVAWLEEIMPRPAGGRPVQPGRTSARSVKSQRGEMDR